MYFDRSSTEISISLSIRLILCALRFYYSIGYESVCCTFISFTGWPDSLSLVEEETESNTVWTTDQDWTLHPFVHSIRPSITRKQLRVRIMICNEALIHICSHTLLLLDVYGQVNGTTIVVPFTNRSVLHLFHRLTDIPFSLPPHFKNSPRAGLTEGREEEQQWEQHPTIQNPRGSLTTGSE